MDVAHEVLRYYGYGSVLAIVTWIIYWMAVRSASFEPNPFVVIFDLMGGIVTAALFWPVLLWRAIWGN